LRNRLLQVALGQIVFFEIKTTQPGNCERLLLDRRDANRLIKTAFSGRVIVGLAVNGAEIEENAVIAGIQPAGFFHYLGARREIATFPKLRRGLHHASKGAVRHQTLPLQFHS